MVARLLFMQAPTKTPVLGESASAKRRNRKRGGSLLSPSTGASLSSLRAAG